MNTTVTVLLLFAFLLVESFAGYSTGLRRPPKPTNPDTVVRPVVYPSSDHTKDRPHWKGHHGGSVEIGNIGEGGIEGEGKIEVGEIDKTDKGGVDKIDDVRIEKVDKEEIDQEGKISENTKVVGPHSGSDHWVPSHDATPTEEKKVPQDFPNISGKDEISVKLDDKSVNEEKHPHFPDGVPSKDSSIDVEEKEQPYISDKEILEDDISVEVDDKFVNEEKHPHFPDGVPSKDSSIDVEEKEQPYISDKEISDHDISVKVDDKSVNEEKQPHFPDRIPLKDSSVDIDEKEQPYIPDNVDLDIDISEKIPQPHPDIPETVGDEEIPLIPHDVSDEVSQDSYPDKPLNEDLSIDIVPGGIVDDVSSYEDLNEKIDPEIQTDGESAVGIGPLPYPDVPPRDIAVIPPGVKIEVLEPYPIKVGAGNGNINLYELMERLELSRFLHLVEEANLKDLLTGEGPLTIFAPSDFALSKLDADTIRKLATNQELLRQFVLYHCVDGQIYGPSFEERDNSAMTTKFDRAIHINKYGETWFVNGIPITARDQTCSNGVIHVLDACLYPFPTGDSLETLESLENFKIYTELIRNAKLDKELKGEVIYTIFAPTDVAFSKLPPANLEWLKWDIPAIKRMFRQLTVNGMYYTTWIPSGNGQLLSIDEETTLSLSGYPDSMNVNGIGLSQYDITTSNGCIHAIDDIWFLSQLGTPSSSSSQKKHDD